MKWFSNISKETESEGSDKETAACDIAFEKILRTTWLFENIRKNQSVL